MMNKRREMISDIVDFVQEKGGFGIMFNDVKSLKGENVMFQIFPGEVRISIEGRTMDDDKQVTFQYLSDDVLKEIMEQIES